MTLTPLESCYCGYAPTLTRTRLGEDGQPLVGEDGEPTGELEYDQRASAEDVVEHAEGCAELAAYLATLAPAEPAVVPELRVTQHLTDVDGAVIGYVFSDGTRSFR